MKFFIYTLGCKVNAYESEVMKEKLLANNFILDEENPDIIIVNTFSVTNVADQKSQKMIRRMKREYPNCILVVCGCSSENKESDYQKMGIDILIGNKDKSKIVDLITCYLETKKAYSKFYHTRKLEFEDMEIDKFTTHTRAFVKIQDGCDNFCSYCIIPFVRGSIRSKDFHVALNEIKTLVENGHQEIVLTGIHTGSYGTGTDYDLTDLIHEMSKLDKLRRIRISSIEMNELNDKFLKEFQNNPKICDHLHIPLQAGSDEILKKMNRKYNLDEFKEKIQKIREIRPEIAITTDIIVGFPHETDELFETTMKTAEELKFSKIHVFPYSVREGTVAARMDNQIPEVIKKERSKRLVALSNELEEAYQRQFIGRELSVLVEQKNLGCTSNYLKVQLDKEQEANTFVNVFITSYENGLLYGKVSQEK